MKISAELKYRDAILLYSDSDLSIKIYAKRTGVGFSAFSSYLSKHHRDLIIKRHNLSGHKNVKLRGRRGQTTESHYKYRDAIAACDSIEYIEYNISQIARIFDVDCSSLATQLRKYYPEIVPRRELERQKMGIHVNLQYGARKWTKEAYKSAIEVLGSTDVTIEEAATQCNVSPDGLREHILAYYPQVTLQRQQKRTKAVGQKIRGKRNGSWAIHEPQKDTIAKYESAIELYRNSSLSIEEIVAISEVNIGGFRYCLRTWYPELMVQRRGFDEGVPFEQTKRYKKTTAEKYADAIERLKKTDETTAKVAAEFELHPEVFRMYVKEHYPELTAVRGMIKAENGRTVSNRSVKKYAEALRLYESTSESLKSIASRLGLIYNSLGGYIRRNHPEAIEKHNSLIITAKERFQDGIKKLQESDATINTVMSEMGYNEYFREYVKVNHPELLEGKRQRKKITKNKVAADKYALAIDLMQTTSVPMKEVAEKYDLNIHSFRKYIRKHRPELVGRKIKKTKFNRTE